MYLYLFVILYLFTKDGVSLYVGFILKFRWTYVDFIIYKSVLEIKY